MTAIPHESGESDAVPIGFQQRRKNKGGAASSSSGAAASSSAVMGQGAVSVPELGKGAVKIPGSDSSALDTVACEPPRDSQRQQKMEATSDGLPSEEDDDSKPRDSCDSMTTSHNSSQHESAFKGEQRLDGFKGADGKGIGGRPWWALSEKKQKSKRKRAELHQAKVKAENQEAQIFDRETRIKQQLAAWAPPLHGPNGEHRSGVAPHKHGR